MEQINVIIEAIQSAIPGLAWTGKGGDPFTGILITSDKMLILCSFDLGEGDRPH